MEFWATDSGATNTGVVSAYADVSYSSDIVACEGDPVHGSLFNLFPDGVCTGTSIDELGGSQFSSDVGVEPDWARVAYVPFMCDSTGFAHFQLAPAASESSAFGRGLVPISSIDYGQCSVECVGCRCIYDLDNNCNIAGGDLGWFAPCWLCQSGQPCWDANDCEQKDWDCNGTVAGGDLGWFAAGWLKSCDQLDPVISYPSCQICNGPVVCPWPSVREGRSTMANAGAASLREGTVRLAVRLVRALSDSAEAEYISQSSLGRFLVGESVFAEIWAKDTTPGSDGLTAAFVDVHFDPLELRAVGVEPGGAFNLFRTSEISGAGGVVHRAGGATMEAGQGAGTWSRVAVVKFEVVADLTRPRITVLPAPGESIAARGRGLVPSDRITIAGRVEAVAAPSDAQR